MKKQTKFKIIGWLLFLAYGVLSARSDAIPFFKEGTRFKYFSLVGSASCSVLAYAYSIDYKEETASSNYKGINWTLLKPIGMFVFMAFFFIYVIIVI